MDKKAVKTKKVVKRRLNFKRVFLLALIIFLIVLIASSILKIDAQNVVVTGNVNVSSSAIIKEAGLNNKTSFLGLNEKDTCNKIKSLPLINTCKVKRELDLKLVIEVTENTPLFFYTTENKLALSNGKFADITNTFGVPTLINYVPEDILSKFISGLSEINSDIIRSISEIEYTPSTNSNGTYIDEERFMLSMNDGNIVYINNRNLSVLASYNKIYASIGDKKGYYNFDSDFNNYFFEEFDSE